MLINSRMSPSIAEDVKRDQKRRWTELLTAACAGMGMGLLVGIGIARLPHDTLSLRGFSVLFWWYMFSCSAILWLPLLFVAYALGRRQWNLKLLFMLIMIESCAIAWFVEVTSKAAVRE